MSSWLFLILLVAVVLWLVGAYNGLVSLKNQTLNAFKQIDVQLKRRHDLIPNLVNAVKGAMDFERSTLEAVIQARNQAVQGEPSGPRGGERASSTTTRRPSTTRASSSSRRRSSRGWPGSSPPTCGRSRTRASAPCRRSTSR